MRSAVVMMWGWTPRLVEGGGDVVSGAGDVGDVEVGGGVNVDGDDAHGGGGVVIGVGETGIADGAVALGVRVTLQGDFGGECRGFSVDFVGVNEDGDVLRFPDYLLVFLRERRFEQLRFCFRVRRQKNFHPSQLLDCVVCADGRDGIEGLFSWAEDCCGPVEGD